MDYLNSIREEAALSNDLQSNSPVSQERSNGIPNDIPVQEYSNPIADLPDPSAASIRDKVLRETQRRQNAITDEKRLEAEQREELQRQEEEHQRRLEEEAHMTAEEVEQKKLEEKWRRDFERQQHAKEETAKAKYADELRKREEEERLKKQEEFTKQLELEG